MEHVYNDVEPFIWYAVAVLLVPALRRHAPLRQRLLLAMVVAVFGTSDFFESEAWWTPWWLLAWKAGSLAIIGVVSWRIYRRKGHRAA